jgi:hypothetical protein
MTAGRHPRTPPASGGRGRSNCQATRAQRLPRHTCPFCYQPSGNLSNHPGWPSRIHLCSSAWYVARVRRCQHLGIENPGRLDIAASEIQEIITVFPHCRSTQGAAAHVCPHVGSPARSCRTPLNRVYQSTRGLLVGRDIDCYSVSP